VTKVLYLIRHGRSDLDSAGMFASPRGEQWDPPLSSEGRSQADLLARRLRLMDVDPSAIHCSPLRRAVETARPYAEGAGLEIARDDDLIEAHIGGWEGLPFEEILASDADLLHRVRNQQSIWDRGPGVEHPDDFRARVVGAVENIVDRDPGTDVVVVAHGGVINAYCGAVLGLPGAMFFLPENTSINSVIVDGARRTVRFLNDIAHLTDPQLFEGP
jgi:broad specificity phosphatase PhoE